MERRDFFVLLTADGKDGSLARHAAFSGVVWLCRVCGSLT